jgi:hypothetical protein
MLRPIYFMLFILLSFCAMSCKTQKVATNNTPVPLSKQEMAEGIKEMLTIGLNEGVQSIKDGELLKNTQLSIPFPKSLERVEKSLKEIGLGDKLQEFVTAINQSSTQVVQSTQPIFASAIQDMNWDEAQRIVNAGDGAATIYLRQRTEPHIVNAVQPLMQKGLDKSKAAQLFSFLVSSYNKIPFVEPVNPDLSHYLTKMLVEALFFTIARKEYAIRHNPAVRTTVLLQKVFNQ